MQLTLDIKLSSDATFDNYVVGANQEAVMALKQFAVSEGEQYIYCFGPDAVGCSHLLQASCHWASQSNQTALYVPLKEFIRYEPEILQGLESLKLVCVDDIEAIAGREDWEEAAFDLFNRLRDSGTKLLVAGKSPAAELAIKLADLRSRLSWGVAYQLKSLSDEDKPQLLAEWADSRGFSLSSEVISFILSHYPRDMKSLQRIMQALDKASLEYQRKITIPLVKDTLS